MADNHEQQEQKAVHERLALPFLIPAAIFVFAVLIIYALSRIYLELNRKAVGDVTMATPLALAVALAILGVAAYLASRPSVPRWQLASIASLAIVLLTGGAIAAAVIEDEEHEVAPPTDGTVTPPPEGGVSVELVDFEVHPDPESVPAGPTTFNVTNAGSTIHNLRVAHTDLAQDDLPLADNAVVEDELDIIASLADLDPGASDTVDGDLPPGAYVLFCNVVGHYDLGMHAAFTVTEGGGPPPGGAPAQ
jgi:uncharacterized cupredoxin-like copper-binding protein